MGASGAASPPPSAPSPRSSSRWTRCVPSPTSGSRRPSKPSNGPISAAAPSPTSTKSSAPSRARGPPSAPISVSRCRRCSRRATSTATACFPSANFERSWSWWRRRWSTTNYASCTPFGSASRAQTRRTRRSERTSGGVIAMRGDGDDDDDAEEERGAKGEAAAKKKGGGGGGGSPERKGVRVEAVGIDSGVFVKVLEDLGLLGVRGAREMERDARTSLLPAARVPTRAQGAAAAARQPVAGPRRRLGESPNSPDALRRGGSSHGGSQSASPEGRRSATAAAAKSRRRRPRWRRRGGARARRTVNLQMLQHSWSTNAAAMVTRRSRRCSIRLQKMAPRRRGDQAGPTEKDVLRRECEQLNQHLSQMQKLVGRR